MIAQGGPNAAYNAAYQTAAYNQYYQNYQQQYATANFQRQNSAFQPAFSHGLQQYPPALANTVKTTNTPRVLEMRKYATSVKLSASNYFEYIDL